MRLLISVGKLMFTGALEGEKMRYLKSETKMKFLGFTVIAIREWDHKERILCTECGKEA